MIRNLKALGLALVAVFAMSAMAASAAQATPADFYAAQYPASIHAEGGLQVFEGGVGKLTCEEVTGRAELPNQGSTLTSTEIIYRDSPSTPNTCHATAVKFPTHIDMNGCHYTFTSGDTVGGTGMESEGTLHITGCENNTTEEDPGNGSITITITNLEKTKTICTIHVPEQTVNGVKYTDTTDGTVDVNTSGVSVAESHEGSLCGTGSGTAKYTGSFLASGENGEEEPDGIGLTDT